MIRAILDTNILVQGLIGSADAASARTVDAVYDGAFRIVYSPDTLDELLAVLIVPSMRDRHGMSDDEILEFVASLLLRAERVESTRSVSAALTKDATDAKFLALAEESGADYLVTNDHRHLLHLGTHGQTCVVTPAAFLRHLG